MACAWRNFIMIFSRPLFVIIFRPKILFFCHIFNFDPADQSWVCHILGVKVMPNFWQLGTTYCCSYVDFCPIIYLSKFVSLLWKTEVISTFRLRFIWVFLWNLFINDMVERILILVISQLSKFIWLSRKKLLHLPLMTNT